MLDIAPIRIGWPVDARSPMLTRLDRTMRFYPETPRCLDVSSRCDCGAPLTWYEDADGGR